MEERYNMVHLLLAIIYISFISLGLPDALLGSAWPTMHADFGVPVSYAGSISMIIAIGTVISSLLSDRLTRKLGTGKLLALSVATTAIAILGFSFTSSFWMLCLWAVPYGLGAGSVDAALNNYVALHYASRHMSWLHCMWGVGTAIGPYFMGYALSRGQGWGMGYRYVALIQITLTIALFLSLPLWRKGSAAKADVPSAKALSLKQVIAIPGAKNVMIAFFCYCAMEQTAMLWGSSYLNLYHGLSTETAARLASLFCLGITFGRGVSGFMTLKFDDNAMIRIGSGVALLGILAMLLPLGSTAGMIGLLLVGLGCAPIYPSIIHSTPDHFGAENSQSIIGIQMASAYVGICTMPPLFGLIANHISVALLPPFLLALLALMVVMYESLSRKHR